MSLSSIVTIKGTNTIPKEVRDNLGLKPGSRVAYTPDGMGGYRIQREFTLEEVRKQNELYITENKIQPKLLTDEDRRIDEGLAQSAVKRFKNTKS